MTCIIYVICPFFLLLAQATSNFPLSQLLALRDLYTATSQNQISTCYSNWNFFTPSPNPCYPTLWKGLQCDQQNKTVTSLNILNCATSGSSLPDSLVHLSDLTNLNIVGNQFSGTIPESIGQLSGLYFLAVGSNRFVGKFPFESCFKHLPNLKSLILSDNSFTGTIPTAIGGADLHLIDIAVNSFSGQIPSTIGNLVNLKYANLASNQFTGTLPWQLGYCKNLVSFTARSNLLSGSGPLARWPDSVTVPMWPKLESLDMSYNNFQGPINQQIGSIQSLGAVIVQSTCFSGSLPIELCNWKSLKSLILVGLSDNSKCQQQGLWRAVARDLYNIPKLSPTPNNLMTGTIPSCLFSLPLIETIILSGNGFQGPLVVPALAPNLSTINLSQNLLSGQLPLILQRSPASLQTLDLSGNKLTGSWDIDFRVPGTKLDLSINRFSGKIPRSFYATNITDLRVLNQNLLFCPDNSAPPADPDAASYSCSDSQLVVATLLLLALVGALIIVLATVTAIRFELRFIKFHALERGALNIISSMTAWLSVSTSLKMHLLFSQSGAVDLKRFLAAINNIRDATYKCMFTVLFVLLPIYPITKVVSPSSNTYQMQYTWIVSAAMLRGAAPCEMLWGIILFFAIILGLNLLHFRTKFTVWQYVLDICCPADCKKDSELVETHRAPYHAFRRFFGIVLRFISQIFIYSANFIIVFVVNTKFVQAIESARVTAAQKPSCSSPWQFSERPGLVWWYPLLSSTPSPPRRIRLNPESLSTPSTPSCCRESPTLWPARRATTICSTPSPRTEPCS